MQRDKRHAQHLLMRGDIQRLSLFADGAIGVGRARPDDAEEIAFGRKHMNAARRGGEKIAGGVDRETVRQSGFAPRKIGRAVMDEGFARLNVAGGEIVAKDDRARRIGNPDVKRCFVRREADAVGECQIVDEQRNLAGRA